MLNKDRKLRVFVKVAMFSLFTCDLSGWKQIYQSASQESNDEETYHEIKRGKLGKLKSRCETEFWKKHETFYLQFFCCNYFLLDKC